MFKNHKFLKLSLFLFFQCLFIPFWVLFDGVRLLNGAAFSDVTLRVVALAAADGFLAFAQNLVAFTMLSIVSPVSYSEIGRAHV